MNKFSLVILDNPRLKEEYESKIVNGVEDVGDDASQSTDMWVSQRDMYVSFMILICLHV